MRLDACVVLICSLAVRSEGWPHIDVLSPPIYVILIDSSTGSPVHVLMLSIQAVRVPLCLLFGRIRW